MEYPILCYLDPSHSYVIYTDSRRIGWSGVLTQEHTGGTQRENEESPYLLCQHPIQR